MEEVGEGERGLCLRGVEGGGEGGLGAEKERVVEKRYDLCGRYDGRVRGGVDAGVVTLSVCDHVLVATVVMVNVVGFWRGLFGILSQFEDVYQLCFVYLLGSVIACHFTIARKGYKRQLENKSIWNGVLRRGYTYVFGCACVAQWAGLWFFLDAMSGLDVYPPLAYSVICSAILIYIRLYRNVLAPPITFCTDRLDDYFQFNTVFNIQPTKENLRLWILRCCGLHISLGHWFYPGWFLTFRSRKEDKDVLLSGVVIAPAVVTYWRGSWYLLELYVFPEELRLSLMASGLVGTLVQVVLGLGQEWLEKRLGGGGSGVVFFVTSRLYTYVYSLASVNMWRGGWKALDLYSGTEPLQVVVPTAIGLVALVGMKTMRNLSSAPLAVVVDTCPGYFRVPTMFNLSGTKGTSLYVVDCFFSVFVIGSLVVVVWRGVWCLTDVFLYPEDERLSAFGSLGIGYGVVVIVFCVQIPIRSFCERLTGFWRLLVADVYVFLSFVGTINLWRGIWNLLNLYFLPESPVLSCWTTHLGSFCVLVLMKCSNSMLVRGVYLDGEEGGKCVVFPISYLRLMLEKRRSVDEKKVEWGNACGEKGDAEKGAKESAENGRSLPRSMDPA